MVIAKVQVVDDKHSQSHAHQTSIRASIRPYGTIMSVRAPRKGENYELSVDLNSEYREKRKDAIKRTIASMTVGKGRLHPLI